MKKQFFKISNAFRFRIGNNGKVYGLLSESDGEFYIAPEVLAILCFFSEPKMVEGISHEIHEYIKKYFSDITHKLPSPIECKVLIEDLIESGFLVDSKGISSFKDDAGFSDPWIQWAMLADENRSKSYEEAIKQYVDAKTVALDIGSGSGYLSACALFYGAKKVYAIEETKISDSIIPTISKLSLDKDRLKLFANNSFDVDLPSDINLVISELFGNDPFQEGLFSTLNDITKRLVNKKVKFIPHKLELFAEIIDLIDHPVKQRVLLFQEYKNYKSQQNDANCYFKFLEAFIKSQNFDRVSFPIQIMKNDFLRSSKSVKLGECSLNPIPCDEKKFSKYFFGEKIIDVDSKSVKTPLLLVWFRTYLTPTISISSHPYEKDYADHWSPIAVVLNCALKSNNKLCIKHNLSSSLNAIECEILLDEKKIGSRY